MQDPEGSAASKFAAGPFAASRFAAAPPSTARFDAAPEHPFEAGDNCLRDVVALSTLPAIWTGAEPLRIAESLAASVFTMLDPAFVFVSFLLSAPAAPVSVAQTGRHEIDAPLAEQIGLRVLDWARAHDPDDLLSLDLPGRSGTVLLATRAIGLNAERGAIAAAFPAGHRLRPTDLLLLNVAATQAAVAVQNVNLLHSLQASELRAVQAREIAEALNLELRNEVAQRERVEQALHESEEHLAADLSALRRIQQVRTRLMSGDELKVVLAEILAAATDVTGTDKGNVQLYDPESGVLHTAVHRGFGQPLSDAILPGGIIQSTPLLGLDGRQLGQLNNYFSPPAQPDEHDLRYLDLLARMASDFIERWHSEQSIRRSEARFRALAMASSNAIYRMNADWTEMRFLVGDEFIADRNEPGQSWIAKYIAPEDQPAVKSAVHEATAAGSMFEMEYRVIRADGTPGWAYSRAVPIFDEAGNIVEWFGTASDVTGRKESEQALRLSEDRYRMLAEQVSDGIHIVDKQGRFLDSNRVGHEMLGYTLDELRALSITDIIAPEELKKVPGQFASLDAGEPVRSDWEFKRKDGTVFTGELMARRLPDGRYEGVLRNVAERKLRERQLAEQSRLLDLSNDAIFVRDSGSGILFWNQGAEKLYGFTAEEARNRSSHELLRTQFPEPLPLIEEHLLREGHWSGELIHTKRDGGKIHTFSRWAAQIDAGGNVQRILESNTDITERKRQEQELRDREAQFRNLAEALPTLCWMAYGDGHVFWYNSRWYEYTGTTLEEGWGWQRVIDPAILPEVMERWDASIRAGENFEMVFPLRKDDGSFRPFLTRVVPVRDEGGFIVRWFGTSTDIAAQKEVERELRNANSDLEQFAYSVSHDLQEPVRTVKIFSQLLAAEAGDKLGAQSIEYLDNVISGATRMESLLRDLLLYAQTTRLERPTRPTDAKHAIEAALTALKGAVAETGAVMDIAPLPTLHVHPTQLEQLFQNLIGNAIKYRRPGVTPAVQIKSKKLNKQWLFSVSDNGIGIEPQYKERIFGLFKRLHTGDSYSGTGIGLALCQRIVERHNGRIWVESKPGEGSTFYFTLPE